MPSEVPTSAKLASVFLAECRRQMAARMEKIRHCVDQLNDRQIWWRPHEGNNSIGNLLLHLAGNLRQWIVHGVGGASDDRNRPAEFSTREPIEKEQLIGDLQDAIDEAAAAIEKLSPEELLRVRRIQGFEVTGLTAIFDSVAHLHGHTQEIICLTRMQLGDAYRFHWMPTTPEEGA